MSVRRKKVVWKDYVERIMNEENDCDYHVAVDAVKGPVVSVGREKVLQALSETKTGRSPGL